MQDIDHPAERSPNKTCPMLGLNQSRLLGYAYVLCSYAGRRADQLPAAALKTRARSFQIVFLESKTSQIDADSEKNMHFEDFN